MKLITFVLLLLISNNAYADCECELQIPENTILGISQQGPNGFYHIAENEELITVTPETYYLVENDCDDTVYQFTLKCGDQLMYIFDCCDYLPMNCIYLPIEFTKFEAIKKTDYNLITWEAEETGINENYYIERSLDGFNWIPIQQVKANNQIQYSYRDAPISAYYRIRNENKYTAIKTIQRTQNNPDYLYNISGHIWIEVYDNQGIKTIR